jgi:hypothetical protein
LAHLRKTKSRGGGRRKWKRPGNAGNDWRLGPRRITHRRVAAITRNWKRYGGASRADFLRTHWDRAAGRWRYPLHDGYATRTTRSGATVPDKTVRTLRRGERIDRFGAEPRGRYLSPDGTPYEQRALPPGNLSGAPGDTAPHGYHRYQVQRPFNVESGPIAPAFNQPGGGTQHVVDGSHIPGAPANADVEWLVNNGFLRRLPLGSP